MWVLATAALVGIGGGTEPGSIPSHLSERTWDLEEELWYVASPPQEVAHISAHETWPTLKNNMQKIVLVYLFY